MGLKAYATATKQTAFAQNGIVGCFKANHNANTSNLSALAQEEIFWNKFISLRNGQGPKLYSKVLAIEPNRLLRNLAGFAIGAAEIWTMFKIFYISEALRLSEI